MTADFVFIVNYECPRCHAALEDRSSGPPAWLRCPSCGRASLTPEHDQNSKSSRIEQEGAVFVIPAHGPGFVGLPAGPRPMAGRPSAVPDRVLTTRRLLGAGFFVAAIGCFFAVLEANGVVAAVAGVLSLIFLFLLSRPAVPKIRE